MDKQATERHQGALVEVLEEMRCMRDQPPQPLQTIFELTARSIPRKSYFGATRLPRLSIQRRLHSP
jgi:hypothetical protein